MKARSQRRKAAPVTTVTDRAKVNYTWMARHAPTPAGRAFWARKAAGK